MNHRFFCVGKILSSVILIFDYYFLLLIMFHNIIVQNPTSVRNRRMSDSDERFMA